MRPVIISNSIAAQMDIPSADMIARPGATMTDLFSIARTRDPEDLKIIIGGITDFGEKGYRHITARRRKDFQACLRDSEDIANMVVCPIYPPTTLAPSDYNYLDTCNTTIQGLNVKRGEGTPEIFPGVFVKIDGRMHLDRSKLRDECHPTSEVLSKAADVLTQFIRKRAGEENRDTRGRNVTRGPSPPRRSRRDSSDHRMRSAQGTGKT